MKYLPTLLLLLSCTPPATICKYDTVTVYGDVPLDCTKVTHSFEVLRESLENGPRATYAMDDDTGYSFETFWPQTSILDEYGGFDATFRGMEIVVQDEKLIHCGGKEVMGCFNGQVLLPATQQGALLHEALHFLDCKRGHCDNTTHQGWMESGYTGMGDAFYWMGPKESWATK